MLTLGNLFVLMLLAAGGAWLWHAHGLRERALAKVKQHCQQAEVILLDDNVALRRIALLPDARGRKRLARVYGFEFTVTSEQRHAGTITMFGEQVGHIELAPHPFMEKPSTALEKPDIVPDITPDKKPEKPGTSAEVIQLSEWRRTHDKWHH
ncbi:DUF3301 domain-containing protein [Pseudomonas cavernicola]|uniref:DUF3301 domain-containing protein n=1 Tax=Pseudomonas cavernicola TaxID=2320866 RepID=A0A418XK19_9PSED|nr:DUF3301 domain-containing protein [Pseudomonas cavernicola]RJG12781.1 DUF3301 domain-containing protein [Pseudomonas cavernicola]